MTIAALWWTCPTKRHRPHSNSLWERDFVYRPTRTHRRFDCLHAHLVFVTKYRHRVFTDTMLTFCGQLVRGVCAELDTELREFNGEADHYSSNIAPMCANTCGASTSGPRPTSPPAAEAPG
jgi:hypothetical protein